MSKISDEQAIAFINRAYAQAFIGETEGGKSAPKFKPSYKSPEATIKTVNEACRTGNVQLLASCLTPNLRESLSASVQKELEKFEGDLGDLGYEIMKELAKVLLPALEGIKLGKQISSTADTRVYEYTSDLVQHDTQTFKKVDGKWLIAD